MKITKACASLFQYKRDVDDTDIEIPKSYYKIL